MLNISTVVVGHGQAPWKWHVFFARRFNLADPAILTTSVNTDEILHFTNGRDELEYIVQPAQFQELEISLDEINELVEKHHKSSEESSRQKMESFLTQNRAAREGTPGPT